MALGWIFPGQPSQAPGMGAAVAEAFPSSREIYARADSRLGIGLSRICFEGSDQELADARISGLAIFVTSCATIAALREAGVPEPDGAAGFSVGQYAALVAAGVLEFEDALKLVDLRGSALKKAARNNPSTLVSCIGLPEAKIEEILGDDPDWSFSNLNCPNNSTLACALPAAQGIRDRLAAAGALRAEILPVEGGWHSRFVAEAASEFDAHLRNVAFAPPRIMLTENVSGGAVGTGPDWRRLLREHVDHPVRWKDCMGNLVRSGIRDFVEVGHGSQLARIARFIDRTARVRPAQSSEEIRVLAVGNENNLRMAS